jgi:beta-lactamase regulating signal transducer with metallopeptidase domain
MIRALIDHLWQSTLFCAAIGSIVLLLRSNAASVRHGLWLLASVKFLVPFSALYVAGAAVGLVAPAAQEAGLLGVAVRAATPMVSPSSAFAPGAFTSLTFVMAAIWALVALALAARWLRSWHAAELLSRAARPAPGSLPDARVTDEDIEPSVARVIHPVVLLPSALLGRLSPPQLAAVMAHEREHIARHDNLKAQVHRLVETLFWFHPLVWFIGRRLRHERELACDEAVLAAGHEAGDYAGGILAVCRHCAGAHRPQAVAALDGDLTVRIRHILRDRPPEPLGFFKAIMLTMCSASAMALPLAAGALDDAARRLHVMNADALLLREARIEVFPAVAGVEASVSSDGRTIVIANTSLRELIALVYGVRRVEVAGGSAGLDSPRYDIRVDAGSRLGSPDDFDARALQAVLPKLLATRFYLELHVNQRCQQPCGPRALQANAAPP